MVANVESYTLSSMKSRAQMMSHHAVVFFFSNRASFTRASIKDRPNRIKNIIAIQIHTCKGIVCSILQILNTSSHVRDMGKFLERDAEKIFGISEQRFRKRSFKCSSFTVLIHAICPDEIYSFAHLFICHCRKTFQHF